PLASTASPRNIRAKRLTRSGRNQTTTRVVTPSTGATVAPTFPLVTIAIADVAASPTTSSKGKSHRPPYPPDPGQAVETASFKPSPRCPESAVRDSARSASGQEYDCSTDRGLQSRRSPGRRFRRSPRAESSRRPVLPGQGAPAAA